MDNTYAKKSIWKWILLYVIIGAIAYGLMYYFFFYNRGKYSNNSQYPITNSQLDSNVHSETISEQDAINLVKNLLEVKNWLTLFSRSDGTSNKGGKSFIEIDHQDSEIYVIHVYEIIDGHTTTYNWYDVNKRTGSVNAEF